MNFRNKTLFHRLNMLILTEQIWELQVEIRKPFSECGSQSQTAMIVQFRISVHTILQEIMSIGRVLSRHRFP